MSSTSITIYIVSTSTNLTNSNIWWTTYTVGIFASSTSFSINKSISTFTRWTFSSRSISCCIWTTVINRCNRNTYIISTVQSMTVITDKTSFSIRIIGTIINCSCYFFTRCSTFPVKAIITLRTFTIIVFLCTLTIGYCRVVTFIIWVKSLCCVIVSILAFTRIRNS